jgi:hypothetical protein
MSAIPPRHGTATAHEGAARLGLHPTEYDFQAAFLTITDALLDQPSTARYLGPTRDAERWSVLLCGREVDLIYHPTHAMIGAVLPPKRPGDAVGAASTAPRDPNSRSAEMAL